MSMKVREGRGERGGGRDGEGRDGERVRDREKFIDATMSLCVLYMMIHSHTHTHTHTPTQHTIS